LNKNPLRIGLTGGIASGKSMVADFFSELGAPVIDTDVIARQVVEPGAVALEEIRESFGDAIIKGDGSLDRQAMRKIVFADPDKRRRLEAILHPRIREATMLQVDGVTAPYMLIVVPLLVESPMLGLMDRVLVVDCNEEIQLERLLARDGENEATARSIIAAQASREARLAKADDVVINDSDADKARKQVLKLHQSYLSLAAG
jgi:dephospho-CoA kinase